MVRGMHCADDAPNLLPPLAFHRVRSMKLMQHYAMCHFNRVIWRLFCDAL